MAPMFIVTPLFTIVEHPSLLYIAMVGSMLCGIWIAIVLAAVALNRIVNGMTIADYDRLLLLLQQRRCAICGRHIEPTRHSGSSLSKL